MRLVSLCALFALSIAGTATASKLKNLSFSPSDAQALVIVEERDGLRGGVLTFVPVNLETLEKGEGKLEVHKTTDGRLRTSNPGLQTKGEGLLVPKNMSRFSAGKGPAGDYALVDFTYNAMGLVSSCPKEGAPVFRFKAGQANLVTAEMLPEGGSSSNILSYASARNGSNDDVGDAQSILNEYPKLKSAVVPAELVAVVKFTKGSGKLSACGSGKTLVPNK
jgi:hypothetical protein